MNTEIQYNYIYLLQEREFLHQDVNVYKIGKSKQENMKRINTYPKGSKLLLQIICNDCDVLEKHLISSFKDTFIHRSDIGNEYFQGNCDMMIYMIIESKKAIDVEHLSIKDTHIEIKKLNEKLKELKQEEKLIQIKEQIIKTEEKINTKKIKQEEIDQFNKIVINQSNFSNEFALFSNFITNNIIFCNDKKVALQRLVTDSNCHEEYIKKFMKSKGFKYNKDLRGLGKNNNGRAYKGGYEGVGYNELYIPAVESGNEVLENIFEYFEITKLETDEIGKNEIINRFGETNFKYYKSYLQSLGCKYNSQNKYSYKDENKKIVFKSGVFHGIKLKQSVV